MMKVALYDAREDSPTYGELNEFFVGEKNTPAHQRPPICLPRLQGNWY